MVGHIVLLRWKPDSATAERCVVLDAIADLPRLIDELRDLRVVDDLGLGLPGCRSDAAIIASVDTIDGLLAYQRHPAHRAVVERLVPLLAASMSVQFDDRAPDIEARRRA
jgi:hypothetical protein